jgi:F-type H+-transporting ATPase subunit b
MLIDWFTVGAQMINFLILLALLKIFLFDRITRAMDEREEKINARFEEADRKKRDAQDRAQSLDQEKRKLDGKRRQLIEQAEADSERKRKEWVAQARREVDDLRRQWKDALAEQKTSFGRDLRRLAAEQVYSVSRRVLGDLADEAVEERIIAAFIDRIAELDGEEKKDFSRSLDEKNNAATIRSAFEISTKMRQKITRVVHKEFSESLDVDYQAEPALLAGIELKAAGKKISWNVDDYLNSLQETVREAIQEQTVEDGDGQTQPDAEQEDNKNNDETTG